MNKNIRTGINFGLVSGVLTAAGIVAGLVGAGADKGILLAGVLVVAFADAFSDALSIHLSRDNEMKGDGFWQSIALAFFAKLIVASTFLVPVLITNAMATMVISIIWATLLLAGLGYYMNSRDIKGSVFFILKNLLILAVVILLSYYIGGIFKGY